jgi:hypothetical protein
VHCLSVLLGGPFHLLSFKNLHRQLRVGFPLARISDIESIQLRHKNRRLGAKSRRDFGDLFVVIRIALRDRAAR